ncbi:hypothetical protein GCM10018793_13970 [Streptomyces sulfonofaciens]|uniref:Uncharacterized protein n=1 Tax=Streptomyces sulfonofaciens TaxID=68272 RepID=A0A919FXW3_9ACTN|nr:hypothetical protein GCM10018793_13970 [Streptomyces sulfonofaciens]
MTGGKTAADREPTAAPTAAGPPGLRPLAPAPVPAPAPGACAARAAPRTRPPPPVSPDPSADTADTAPDL